MPYQELWQGNPILCEGKGRVGTQQEVRGREVRDAFWDRFPWHGEQWP